MNAELLLNVNRGNITERQHYGYVVVIDEKKKVLYQKGDINTKFFLRSSEKPFQAVPLIKTGVFDEFKFSLEEVAVCCASHSGTVEHLKTIRGILKKIDCIEDNLLCGILAPLDTEKQKNLILKSEKVTKIHNNCSGKHSGMLAACKKNNWSMENYLDYDHPLQQLINDQVKILCEVDTFEISTDGCGTPTHGVPLINMAYGFSNFFQNEKYNLIKKAFVNHPVLIGGNLRQDTEVMKATKGRILAKVGAEGLCLLFNTENNQTMAVKILDSNMEARAFVIVSALKKNNWISEDEYELLKVRKMFNEYITNSLNNIVGKSEGFL